MGAEMRKCSVCLNEYPKWCFEKVGGKRRSNRRLSVCKSCRIKERSEKLLNQAELQRKKQIRSRETYFRYEETRQHKRELWEEGARAAAGDGYENI